MAVTVNRWASVPVFRMVTLRATLCPTSTSIRSEGLNATISAATTPWAPPGAGVAEATAVRLGAGVGGGVGLGVGISSGGGGVGVGLASPDSADAGVGVGTVVTAALGRCSDAGVGVGEAPGGEVSEGHGSWRVWATVPW